MISLGLIFVLRVKRLPADDGVDDDNSSQNLNGNEAPDTLEAENGTGSNLARL